MTSITTNIKSVVKRINYFIRRTPAASMGVIEDAALRIQARMNVVGKPISYPVQWDSEKQRRAFFATNGFGHGIPYERTGKTKWSVRKSFENEVDLFAPHAAGAVFGMPTATPPFWQSRIHRGRWVVLKDVLTEELARLPKEIMQSLKVLFNEQP